MIVRIATENQYRLADDAADQLNELDNEAVAAVEGGDEARFHELFDQMLEFVRSEGSLLDGDDLEESDIILPPPDLTFAEAQTRVHRRRPDPRLTLPLSERDVPEREPAREVRLDREVPLELGLELQLALVVALLVAGRRARTGSRSRA